MIETLTIRCPTCGAFNRVPREKVDQGLESICGRCKTPLRVRNSPILVTDANFSAEVQHSPVPVLLDMWAPWCAPCRMIAPVIDDLAAEMAGRIRVGKLNVDENPITAERFQVRGIPALLLIKAGREIDRMLGVQPKSEIARRLERALAEV
jgi:thioredoxin 2